MDAVTVADTLMKAFVDAGWPHESPPEQIEPADISTIVDELFLVSDETKKYELPRVMSLAITTDSSSHVLCRLVEFLDVDFHDPDDSNDLLKQAKRRIFLNYSRTQANAICQWLEYARMAFRLDDCQDLLDSAILYWKQRVQTG